MTIRTFYRTDTNVVNMLINNMVHINGLNVIDGYHFIATLSLSPLTQEFARNHPYETELVNLCNGREALLVGISLSQISKGQFIQLAKKHSNYFTVRTGVPTGFEHTAIVGLYTNNGNQYCWVDAASYNSQEIKFIELLDGFDFFYEYSDDHSVYKRWSEKWASVQKDGIGLGLSTDRMMAIYREMATR